MTGRSSLHGVRAEYEGGGNTNSIYRVPKTLSGYGCNSYRVIEKKTSNPLCITPVERVYLTINKNCHGKGGKFDLPFLH